VLIGRWRGDCDALSFEMTTGRAIPPRAPARISLTFFPSNSKPVFHSPLLNCRLKQKATSSLINPTNNLNKDFAFALSLREQQYDPDPAL
jgi:hypothetical protein